MNINLTVVVQVINFIITYAILERLFFKPAVATIQKRDASFVKLSQTIAEQKNNNEILKTHVAEQWHRFQRALQHEVPSLVSPRIMLSSSLYKHEGSLSDKEVETMSSHFAQMLVNKVKQ